MNKKKLINDPVYGFLTICSDLIFDIINHPFFQRLRRIKQLGLTDYVYPGALHTRFHHALGAMHLMSVALNSLRGKDHEISEKEFDSALIAILLHDIGHGPFSHALEHTILNGVHHERLSLCLMEYLNKEFNGELDLAIRMFSNQYERRFFHQLISSQLDMDRLDYLQRDCFFTGVSEGTIGADRIIRMLEIHEDQIVVEEKGIYSIENFLNARRLMYWQVYLHKTTVSTEQMLIQLIRRAKHLAHEGREVFAPPALRTFLYNDVDAECFTNQPEYLHAFALLDDYDIWGSIKVWMQHQDKVLAKLSNMLLHRHLFRAQLSADEFPAETIARLRENLGQAWQLGQEEVHFFISHGAVTNAGYLSGGQKINILKKSGEIIDVAQASDLPNIKALSKIVKKYYLCYPKSVSL